MLESVDLYMEIKIFVIFIVLLLNALGIHSQFNSISKLKRFDCERDVRPRALNLTAVSGYWYEVARVPNMDILKCLNVSVPAAVDKDLELQLEYISSINGETYAKRETVTFPWDDKTRNSTFSLEYVISGNINVSVTYKIIYTDYTNVTFLCGYSGISPIPLFKLLSRQRQLSPTYIDFIKTLAEKAGISRQIIWTEQSPDQCNDAVRPTTGTLAILAISILWMFTKI
ncbi:uncharacterized protein LOC116805473 [Drosophila grimshawi]|uniref:uncharacterized protein LOC116805473 n=1 Tax=Drosophila grimshawi TaxID=7222 RepID=UPI0013EF38FA|nr:uncharacterized protein LOC116805473 [Drosophila grimshawi]